ncbi:MAG: hypothetical protein LBK53_06600 [Heliobacteriaceae bacterium]|jgi:hypothetical protein|nr:hypothetical protein [Heliobacteriaceae bacterium]
MAANGNGYGGGIDAVSPVTKRKISFEDIINNERRPKTLADNSIHVAAAEKNGYGGHFSTDGQAGPVGAFLG